jgi:hypothetical protein
MIRKIGKKAVLGETMGMFIATIVIIILLLLFVLLSGTIKNLPGGSKNAGGVVVAKENLVGLKDMELYPQEFQDFRGVLFSLAGGVK